MPNVRLERLHNDLGAAAKRVDYDLLKLTNLEQETKLAFVKEAQQAVLNGYSLGDIRKVASSKPDKGLDRLLNETAAALKEGVFMGNDSAIERSMQKVSSRLPVPEHPLTVKFANWKEAYSQLRVMKDTKKVLLDKQAEVLSILRERSDV